MLGKQLGTITGNVLLRRVLSVSPGSAKIEATQQGSGTLLGVKYQDTSTYWSESRPDGTLYGEGRGVYTGKGGEVATWTGQGVGTVKRDGSVSFRPPQQSGERVRVRREG